jgi:DMSO reductase family type II enzyme heme b subunit
MVIFACVLPSTLVSAGGTADIYDQHCAPCHGIKGDGQGPAAYLLSPKPRDFTTGVYKFRSTPSGSPPTDQDLLRTLEHGIPGTAMPMWDRLPEVHRLALVQYVKSFSDVFEDEDAKEAPIEITTPPLVTPESITAGQKVYQNMMCADCHGPRGKGDGPSAPTLTDDEDRPIRPYDFTRGPGLMKGGSSQQDIYRTFMTGLDGTPMPSYGDSLDEDERWQLVSYVQSLATSTEGTFLPPAGTPVLQAVKAVADPSLDPDDAIWLEAPVSIIPLRPLWARDSWVDFVEVQISVGPKAATFRFEWRDGEKNDEVTGMKGFRDAVALQFVPDGAPGNYIGLPFIAMGDKGKGVTIWHWKADWETREAVLKQAAAMDQMAPQADLTTDKLRLAGLAAGNPLSKPTHKSPVQVLVAKGFGSLTSLPDADQTVAGRGVWRDGVWTVVMRQPLDSTTMLPLRQGKPFPVAMAVWDGDAGDRNGQKAVSQWMELTLDETQRLKYVGPR